MASSEALDLLHLVMCAVTFWRITMATRMASKVGVFFHCCFVCCCRGGCQGNKDWVVTLWRHSEASGIALDMLHWAMRSVSHRCISMAIEMASGQGALFPIVDLCININVAKETCYGSFKLKMSYTYVHYYVYCYIALYWLPLLAMNAVLATILPPDKPK